MRLLTQQEAQLVLQEAYSLKAKYAHAKSRLGQSIHWVSSPTVEVTAVENIKFTLYRLLVDKQAEGVDFFYWPDDNKVLEAFYEHFVEQY